MKKERQEGLLELSNISFGHMLKLDNCETQLERIISNFLNRKDVLLSNLCDKGSLVILIKVYSENVSLVKINEIILSIYQYLDDDHHVEVTNAFEGNVELKDYFNLTLVEV